MKSLLVVLLTTGFSSLVLAQSNYQYNTPQTRSYVPQYAAPSANPVTFEGQTDFSDSTVTASGNLGDGKRTNYMFLTPRLLVEAPLGFTGHFSLPFIWATDQSSNQTRFIGRPELGVWNKFAYGLFRLDYGVDLRFPMEDSSIGNAEDLQLWGVYPGYKGKLNFANSSFHIIQTGTVSYNSSATQTSTSNFSDSTSVTTSYQDSSPVVLFVGAGGGIDITSKASIDMTINFANGLGVEHFTETSSSTGQPSTSQTFDDPGADLSYLKLSGAFEIAKGTNITSYISKSLKDVSNHGVGGIQLDDVQAIATLGAGVGFSQAF